MVMLKQNQRGETNILTLPLILAVLFFLAAFGFGIWAFMGREDYKNNAEQKIAEAVDEAVEQTETRLNNEFAEREKEPLVNYKAPQTYGSFSVDFPKTWSAYVDDGGDDITVLMQPHVVRAESGSDEVAYALSVEVVRESFADALSDYDKFINDGTARARPFTLPQVPNVRAMRIDGQINNDQKGAVIVMPLRDKALIISTLSEQFLPDFNNHIVPNFTYSP